MENKKSKRARAQERAKLGSLLLHSFWRRTQEERGNGSGKRLMSVDEGVCLRVRLRELLKTCANY